MGRLIYEIRKRKRGENALFYEIQKRGENERWKDAVKEIGMWFVHANWGYVLPKRISEVDLWIKDLGYKV